MRPAVPESVKRLASRGKSRLLCIHNRVIIGIVRDTRAWRTKPSESSDPGGFLTHIDAQGNR